MQDCSTGNSGTEAILDFQMSWLLRLVTKKDADKTLQDISYNTISILLGLTKGSFEVESVRVWKQWKYIDVKAEVSIRKDGVIENHLVVLENKIYHKFYKEQLDKNSRVILDNYDYPRNRIHFWLVYGNDEIDYDELQKVCKDANPQWQSIWFYDVIGGERQKPIGNDLFDEFWVNRWS